MATDETQAASAPRSAESEPSGDGVAAEGSVPIEKSGVYPDPNPTQQTGKFEAGDVVHMSVVEGGMRIKGVFRVARGRQHVSGAYYEYQLVDGSGRTYQGGEWVRERFLKAESAGAGVQLR